ncbi:MAG: AlpA family phage regulatory protein [Planctomycetia bacterium]|nr:AlpA family phage regulatory protein [Planctomycetia bacterium]
MNKRVSNRPTYSARSPQIHVGPCAPSKLPKNEEAGTSGMMLSVSQAPILHDSSLEQSPERVLITVDEVAAMLSLSKRTIWRILSHGEMPEPIRLGKNVRWRLYEVQQWIVQGCPRPERGNL